MLTDGRKFVTETLRGDPAVHSAFGHLDGWLWGIPAAAAQSGCLETLSTSLAVGCAWDSDIWIHAAGAGRVGVLQWIHEQVSSGTRSGVSTHFSGAFSAFAGEYAHECAARMGRLDVLRLFHRIGHSGMDCISLVDCNHGTFAGPVYISGNVCAAAARGRLKVLKWLRRRHYDWHEYTCASAAVGGHLTVLQWARQQDVHGTSGSSSSPPNAGSGPTWSGHGIMAAR